jgi:hypothetical protein
MSRQTSFQADMRPLFPERDIEAMTERSNLANYDAAIVGLMNPLLCSHFVGCEIKRVAGAEESLQRHHRRAGDLSTLPTDDFDNSAWPT